MSIVRSRIVSGRCFGETEGIRLRGGDSCELKSILPFERCYKLMTKPPSYRIAIFVLVLTFIQTVGSVIQAVGSLRPPSPQQPG
jgi:hypothetical protein